MANSRTREFPHLRILASAGSGKTYALTTRYMRLFAKQRPAHSILASTFTRAAAGQIRDNVLKTLAQAASDPEKRKEFNERLKIGELSEKDIIKLLRKMKLCAASKFGKQFLMTISRSTFKNNLQAIG